MLYPLMTGSLMLPFLNFLFIKYHFPADFASRLNISITQDRISYSLPVMSAKDSSMVASRSLKTESQLGTNRASNHVEPSESSRIATIQNHDERELAQMGYKQVRDCFVHQPYLVERIFRSSAAHLPNGRPCHTPSPFWVFWAQFLQRSAFQSRQAAQQLLYGHGSSGRLWRNASRFQVAS